MKNYFQKIITLFTGNDYPESTQQDFYKWLVDEEHTSEKDEAFRPCARFPAVPDQLEGQSARDG